MTKIPSETYKMKRKAPKTYKMIKIHFKPKK